ncbi:class I SAM-dependent methyltransferase [Azospira restricta]|uniref:SAM-dependent methyltransferase n=1 Tax=Azospira restricta TaxID=404405 RepID=A0A974Y467_9RHOO|nr:SAM-dependent methyltransferase [Azospira restricta]QRJ64310.1 SAM-dependent methyltransferase [Azospira restricta]
MALPTPDPDALAHSRRLTRHITDEIAAAGGWIDFARFMALALYAPGLGYYSGGARKFGAAGDFVTAPELTPAFAQTLAAQAAQVLAASAPHILEAGAGSGRLAADLLQELERRGALPETYAILELSGELRERQRETLAATVPHLVDRVRWLDRLPERFDGLVLANELLDALPVHLVRWTDDAILERGVAWDGDEFVWQERPAAGAVLTRAQTLAGEGVPGGGYLSEIGLAAAAWTASWADLLGRGALLLIDYGFPRREFYHPQRSEGTLMCHYRHHAHPDPFYLPGLQDITAHVDFTAIAEAGTEAGLDFLGYTTQAVFLFNCGLTEVLARTPADDPRRYLPQANAAQKLISPAEMGELFKVIALGRGIAEPLVGFASGDRSATL